MSIFKTAAEAGVGEAKKKAKSVFDGAAAREQEARENLGKREVGALGLLGGGALGYGAGNALAGRLGLQGKADLAARLVGTALGGGLGAYGGARLGGALGRASYDDLLAEILDNPHSSRAEISHPLNAPLVSGLGGALGGGAIGAVMGGSTPGVGALVGAGLGGALGVGRRMHRNKMIEEILAQQDAEGAAE